MKTEIETNNLINLGWFYDNAVYYDMKTKKLYKSNLKKNSTGIMLLTPIISTIIGKIIQSISENLEISNFSILFLFYLVHISIFPKNINIAYLTRSHLILEHFYLFILLSIFSLVLAICILNRRNKALDLSKYKSSFLKYNNQKRKSPFIVILSIIISYIILWGMALWDENFSNLFLFGFIFSNSLFFIKFIEFQPSLNGKNYYIGEN